MNKLTNLLYDILAVIEYNIKPKCRIVISVNFEGDEKSHPATWAFASDTDDITRKVNHLLSLPDVVYVSTRVYNPTIDNVF